MTDKKQDTELKRLRKAVEKASYDLTYYTSEHAAAANCGHFAPSLEGRAHRMQKAKVAHTCAVNALDAFRAGKSKVLP